MFVLDTNVLVAALWSRSGASFRILRRVLQGDLPIAVSVALALEYEAVLKRAAMREASWASEPELELLLDAILSKATLTTPIRIRLRPTLPDPSDDMVLECALQADAKVIVTMNLRDFEPAKRLYRIDVIRPGEFLAFLTRGEKK